MQLQVFLSNEKKNHCSRSKQSYLSSEMSRKEINAATFVVVILLAQVDSNSASHVGRYKPRHGSEGDKSILRRYRSKATQKLEQPPTYESKGESEIEHVYGEETEKKEGSFRTESARKFFRLSISHHSRKSRKFSRGLDRQRLRMKRRITGRYYSSSPSTERSRNTQIRRKWIDRRRPVPTGRSVSLAAKAAAKAAANAEELPPVSFGQFNYQYNLKPDPICVHKEVKPDEKNETAGATAPAVTTTPPMPTDPHIPLTAKHKESILREHNRYRASANPPAADMRIITWDDELEWASETFTNACMYRDIVEPRVAADGSQVLHPIKFQRHSYYTTQIGRNWYAWPNMHRIPDGFERQMVTAWDAEKKYYDGKTKECSGICEHYLQIIWAETFKIGCGASRCANATINGVNWPDTILFVCSYTPRGGLANFMASNPDFRFFDPKLFVPPYSPGLPCSLCVLNPSDPYQKVEEMKSTTDSCWNGLCTHLQRDRFVPFVPDRTTTTFAWTKKKTTPTSPTTAQETNYTTAEMDLQEDVIIIDEPDGGTSRYRTEVTYFLATLLLHLFWRHSTSLT